ncbi:MAG TPA: thioredoxin family protein [bacterium]|nr:thioredoxin family protein [bacterium]
MFKKTILFSTILSLVFLSACSLKKDNVISIEEAKVKTEKFVNENFMDPEYPVTIVSVVEDEQTDLYKASIDLGNGELIDAYISKDGKKFFPQAYEIAELEKTLNQDTTESEGDTASVNTSNDSGTEINADYFNESADFESDKKVVIYFFWGDGCPHCSSQKTAMSAWAEKYSDIEIKTYETWNNTDNRVVLESLAAAYNTTVQGVPMTFIGDKFWVGYADSFGEEMQAKIDECLKGSCENPGKRIK